MQAAEEEALRRQSQLGAWGILDSFRLNHVHTDAASFTHAATSEPVQMRLSFLRHGDVRVEVSTALCYHLVRLQASSVSVCTEPLLRASRLSRRAAQQHCVIKQGKAHARWLHSLPQLP